MSGRLLHHSDVPLHERFDPTRRRPMEPSFKPLGLWLSVEGEDDWRSWCEGEEYGLENLVHTSVVELRADATIIRLVSAADLDEFTATYRVAPRWATSLPPNLLDTGTTLYTLIDWPRVAEVAQGIVIAPYVWARRLDLMWYYGWDCASGCLWDLSCVAAVAPALDRVESS